MKGWKLWTGAAFGGAAFFVQALIEAGVALPVWAVPALGAFGAFLAAVGIGHKIEKLK